MMMLFSETSRFRLLLIMYYLQKYVFIDHTNSMMQINDTHQVFGFLIGLSKLVYGLYCSREHRFCKKFFFFYKQICFLMALAFHVVSHIYVIYVCIVYKVTLNCKKGAYWRGFWISSTYYYTINCSSFFTILWFTGSFICLEDPTLLPQWLVGIYVLISLVWS